MDFPEQGDIVIGRITKVLDYGVFLELLEYDGLQGFVHISNVSSSWVKNIRNFVKENQIRAGKVINIDPAKNQVDISLTKVSSNQQRAKIEEYKQGKRAQKLIELLAEGEKKDFESAWNEVAEPLLEKYDSLFEAFQAILIEGEKAASDVPKKWISPLVNIVEKNYVMPSKTVKGKLDLCVAGSNGVEDVKEILSNAKNFGGDKVDILYFGSGHYLIKATSTDYKSAEKLLKDVSEHAIKDAESHKGKASFERVSA